VIPHCPSARLLAGVLVLATTPTHGGDALEEIVVTATGLSTASSTTKTDTPIIETPQSISIITREEMDVRAVATVADALS
jgi:iron complex outermembrane receptor protein